MYFIVLFIAVNFSLVIYGLRKVSNTPYSKKDKWNLYRLILLFPIIGVIITLSKKRI